MQYVQNEISEEKYQSLKGMTYAEQHKELFPNGVPDAWELGYGYYGHSLKADEDGTYYAVFTLGSSCD